MTLRIEHANLVVRDLDRMVAFVQTAFPDFRVRGEGIGMQGQRWLHIGSDSCYLALNEAQQEAAEPWVPYAGKPGLNHLGFEVDDAAATAERLRAAGYRDSTVPNRHPHRKRIYFHDPEGNDWEFIEYFSLDPAERYDYGHPDLD